jgi:nucleoside-diphosphate-sugar epimerase
LARVLIVGCGCRGQALARDLVAAGHAVRGTTRTPARLEAIRAAGAEPHLGDPDRVATLMPALAGVTIVCWLMGSAAGAPESLAALHGTRLRMALEKMVDTPVRGFVYEAAGSVAPALLEGGERILGQAMQTWLIRSAVLDCDPADHRRWREAARLAIHALLGESSNRTTGRR